MMPIGMRRVRGQLQSPPNTQDAQGQPSGSWTTVATIYADVRHLNGLEAIRAGADTSIVQTSVRIRYRTNVTAAMRLAFGSKTHEIKAVLPDAKKRWLDLACEVVQ
jgi:SPP1 family predicted phage head-tail adaptor